MNASDKASALRYAWRLGAGANNRLSLMIAIVRTIVGIVLALGFVVIAGYGLHASAVVRLSPSLQGMSVLTALGLIMAAARYSRRKSEAAGAGCSVCSGYGRPWGRNTDRLHRRWAGRRQPLCG